MSVGIAGVCLMNPEEAAEWAQEPAGETTETPDMDFESVGDTEPSGSAWYIEGLKNTDPNPPIESVRGLQDIRRHWQSYGIRGLEKWAGVDDAAAYIDLMKFMIGAILEVSDKRSSTNESDERDSNTTDSGVELAPLEP